MMRIGDFYLVFSFTMVSISFIREKREIGKCMGKMAVSEFTDIVVKLLLPSCKTGKLPGPWSCGVLVLESGGLSLLRNGLGKPGPRCA